MIIISFLFFLSVFVGIGVYSVRYSKSSTKDYLLAGQTIKPWLAALSAVATNNSGYMFVGMIGFTYLYGLSSIWMMIGWIAGDFITSLWVHKKLHMHTTKSGETSYASVLSRWNNTDYKWIRIIGGLLSILFLGTYAAAQLKAGSKALHVLFGWDYSVGAIIGAVIVLSYCMAGGIRASIWTDAAQSFVMMCSMLALMVISINKLGGVSPMVMKLHHVNLHYMDIFPSHVMDKGALMVGFFIVGWLFAGFGVIGQPHIMVRFMALENAADIKQVRYFYYSWYVVFYVMTISVGLMARLLLPETSSFDAELALPTLALNILHPMGVGLVLAGLFAATMSTADSQILSCTAAITRDLSLVRLQTYWMTKGVTLFVTTVALLIALDGNKTVFQLVLIAWSALACAFGPLLFTLAVTGGKNINQPTAVAMMLCGLVGMFAWRYLELNAYVYEILPGILCSFVPFFLHRLQGKLRSKF